MSELANDVDAIRGDIEDLNGSADIQEARINRLEHALRILVRNTTNLDAEMADDALQQDLTEFGLKG